MKLLALIFILFPTLSFGSEISLYCEMTSKQNVTYSNDITELEINEGERYQLFIFNDNEGTLLQDGETLYQWSNFPNDKERYHFFLLNNFNDFERKKQVEENFLISLNRYSLKLYISYRRQERDMKAYDAEWDYFDVINSEFECNKKDPEI